MKFNLYGAGNWAEYELWFSRKKVALDIYYDPFFIACEAKMIGGEKQVIVIEESNSNYLIYPFIKRHIPVKGFENYFDISSPYGYCGPYWSEDDDNFHLKSEKLICQYFKENNIVNEFVRYHYLYNLELKFKLDIVNLLDRQIVLVDLNNSWEELWFKHFSSKNRNMIRKVEKELYQCNQTNDADLYDRFIEMYYETMDNANAGSFYYFSRDYFTNLKYCLGDRIKLFMVMKGPDIIGGALFFFTKEIITYYLSARNLRKPINGGTNFLLASVIKDYCCKDFKYLNLGGGTSNEMDNPLLKFKKSFSENTKGFYIGKRIHLSDEYEALKNMFMAENGQVDFNSKAHLLQFYR